MAEIKIYHIENLTEKQAVRCRTEEEAERILSLAENKGYEWADEVKPTENLHWEKYKDDTIYQFKPSNNKVYRGDITDNDKLNEDSKLEIIESEFVIEKPKPITGILPKTSVTKENAFVGLRVIKGKHWSPFNDDIEEGEVGTIVRREDYFPLYEADNFVWVLWDKTSLTNESYSLEEGEEELYIAEEQNVMFRNGEPVVATTDNVVVGTKLIANNNLINKKSPFSENGLPKTGVVQESMNYFPKNGQKKVSAVRWGEENITLLRVGAPNNGKPLYESFLLEEQDVVEVEVDNDSNSDESLSSETAKKQPETIEEWLNTLPQRPRKKAFANTKKQKLSNKVECLSEAINNAFTWDETPEGVDYWNKQYEKYYNGCN